MDKAGQRVDKIKIVAFCGGSSARIGEQTEFMPKLLVAV